MERRTGDTTRNIDSIMEAIEDKIPLVWFFGHNHTFLNSHFIPSVLHRVFKLPDPTCEYNSTKMELKIQETTVRFLSVASLQPNIARALPTRPVTIVDGSVLFQNSSKELLTLETILSTLRHR